MRENTLFTDLLKELDVPFTYEYSKNRFKTMNFPTLFGLSHLLSEYGIDSQGMRLVDNADMQVLDTPYVAQTIGGRFVIVTKATPDIVEYMTEGIRECIPTKEFYAVATGLVFCVYPKDNASEPDFRKHVFIQLMTKLRNWGIIVGLSLLFAYFFVAHGLYMYLSTILLSLIGIAGIGVCILLMSKSLNIKSKTADRFCGVIQDGGCDKVLATDASKLFGIFSWSEVGLTYFTISLVTLLLFPDTIGYLGLFNVCCLPYSFWSVWYQKFKARHWCTLCLTVQLLLWCSFFCYMSGGWFSYSLPITIITVALGVVYVVTLLVINRIAPYFKEHEENIKN